MRTSIQFKKGVLELCVLYLVQKKDRYGYELTQKVNKHIEIAEGALYPSLRRLVKDGYCSTYTQDSPDGPSRKYYHITNLGREYLDELLTEWDKFVVDVNNLREEEDRDE
ncbi:MULTISPECIES: PadR family transcriptional regulator [Listeria]|uniref:PadR family transcriptional regulator n=2 Tax=Listeria TaxID=1637 RepID=A0A099WFT4_9LIST|nr:MULTISPECIES: PadR family transcriptional regulator [Listeria]EUJ42774.1 PadR-like family transcriptional regulator [Listeria riparia FSL S10-1204]KGL43486.1 PadR family transcriptional regulator [Listeria booriae]MBC1210969.1 PadR family transcriptional regulator [Listeria booriae]MBC1227010.1 PadR family transcriptional regulator [Listeria booriae]MBC1230360.1 PadR family transcriptional regulator [Listeria booriae]